ncbi:hypothetical protein DMUE_1968 [Dictyocoela muelleri]|nr:hypothetical protein DMUE_1968 [Dictyocoela muelleri]
MMCILKSGLKMFKIRSNTIEMNNTDLHEKSSEKKSFIKKSYMKTRKIYLKDKNEKNFIDKLSTKEEYLVANATDSEEKEKMNNDIGKNITYFGNKFLITEIEEMIERNSTTREYKNKFTYDNFINIKCIEQNELKEIIKSLGCNISGGHSHIKYELLKIVDDKIVLLLCDFYNLCVKKRQIPKEWKLFYI